MIKKLILVLVIALLAGCGLERSNPLDPVQNGIQVPNEVIGIEVSYSGSDEINLSWVAQNDADGYYIYRSMSYNGLYSRIDDDLLNSGEIDQYTDSEIISGNWYYYKMSAWKWVDNRKLEGWRSGPKTW